MNEFKLVPMGPAPEMVDLIKRLRIKAGMIELGELIAWGSDSALMREAADALEGVVAPAEQEEPVTWRSPDDFPDSLPNTWSREVIAVTNFGRVCSLSCMGAYWQRPADFAEDEEVVAWAEFPDLERSTDAPAVQCEPMAWVTADTVDGQTVNGKPRRIWWENNEGVGIPIYTASPPIAAYRKGGVQQSAPDVAGLVEALEREFPLLDEDGLCETLHHCEWAIQQDRKRLHATIAAHRKRGGEA